MNELPVGEWIDRDVAAALDAARKASDAVLATTGLDCRESERAGRYAAALHRVDTHLQVIRHSLSGVEAVLRQRRELMAMLKARGER